MNSKQTRKAKRRFMREAGPKIVQARLLGASAALIKSFQMNVHAMSRLDAYISGKTK